MIEPVAQFKGQLWLSLGILGAGLAIAAQLQVLVGLAPLRRLQGALGRVRDGVTQQLDGDFPTEIMPLVTEFNHVLAQNAEVVARARNSAGNLAHALKTPLSVLANAAALPERKGDALARLVSTQVDAARKQVDYHLARAKAAAAVRLHGMKTPIEPADPRTVAHDAAYSRRAGVVTDAFSDRTGAGIPGEEQDLQEMLGNLIDNACKWAASSVEIQARQEKDSLVLTIDDDGNGIEADQRLAMLHRGVRADEGMPGTGLGLAIVDDLARMYGGSLALSESGAGGLRATLRLPAS